MTMSKEQFVSRVKKGQTEARRIMAIAVIGYFEDQKSKKLRKKKRRLYA